MAIVAMTSPEMQQRRELLLKWFFEGLEGFVRIGVIDRHAKEPEWQQYFYQWPEQTDSLLTDITTWSAGMDVYFAPMLFSRPTGKKEFVKSTPVVWADLDHCDPENLKVAPSMTVLSSSGRFQGYWRLDRKDYPPAEVEEMCRRIAYTHEEDGADKSGWDLTQMLRLPFTQNHKYTPPQYIKVLDTQAGSFSLEELAHHYSESLATSTGTYEFPRQQDLPQAEDIQLFYAKKIHPGIVRLLETEPEPRTWSETLWQLIMMLFETGMTREETFVMVKDAACNKFAREGRSDAYLWKDVCRGWVRFAQQHRPVTGTLEEVQLLTDEERASAEADRTLVEEYIEWASSLGDAATQYHEAGAFVILSALLAGNVRLPTSYGVLLPNLWFMILADTTLTRKTTAMDIAMELVVEVDSDVVLATDGSIEGLFTGMSIRPGRPSVFLRDEFSGLVESMTKKDYYAGMAETFTKLYDGKYQKRMLRKEIIEVKDPVLILFAGGIRNRILSLLTWEHVASGFLPRFVFITAESDVSRLQPLGPPTSRSLDERERLVSRLSAMHAHYAAPQTQHVGSKIVTVQVRHDAVLTEEAWVRYRDIEEAMLKAGVSSPMQELATPTLDRLCKSGLKAAVLIAASRSLRPQVVVEVRDIIKAFWYIERWRAYTSDVLDNIGHTGEEKDIRRVQEYIQSHEGCLRSEVMQRFSFNSRKAEIVLSTLEQRDQIVRARSGRGERLHSFQYGKHGGR